MSSTNLLPLYHESKRQRSRAKSPFRTKETSLLVVLLVMFIIAWSGLVLYVPDVQTRDETSYQNAYESFHHRIPLSSSDNMASKLPPVSDVVKESEHTSSETQEKTNNVPHSQETVSSQVTEHHETPQKESQKSTESTESVKPTDTVNEQRKHYIKSMIKHAWDGYAKYGFGENELKPMAKKGHYAYIFGKSKLGATLVDSLDTLYIAGLYDEFEAAKNWVKESFNIDEVSSSFVSFFEFNIRFIGGFLSAYALSGDKVFKEKAIYLADKLMPSFKTPTGISKSLINLKTGQLKNWGWASGKSSILSEIGSLQLEYQFLTFLSQDPIYLQKVLNIRDVLKRNRQNDGTYPNFINPDTGRWGSKHLSLGALGDSFYEYLLKAWLITNKDDTEARDMFYSAIDALEDKVLQYRQDRKFLMVSDNKNGRSEGKMQHLACFTGGMYGLASLHAINGKSKHYMDIAKNITRTCHGSYSTTASNLGAEAFKVDDSGRFSSRANEKMYLLRPETVESYFYLWRLTHDPIYREWGWELAQALEKHCKVSSGGYSGIKDVYSSTPAKDDVQQSFFIAETLKYLYLLFCEDDVMSLDRWVFNTEAHPLPILSRFPVNANLNQTILLG